MAEALLMTGSAVEAAADCAINAESGEVRFASAWLERACAAHGVPAEPSWRLDLCLNEVLANILAHGGEAARRDKIRLWLAVARKGCGAEAKVTVSDTGRAFDPLHARSRSQPLSLDEAEPGGLGMPLLRQFSDDLGYRHADGRNHLSFSVRWNEAL